mgnify:CR=1 FL=1
MKLFVISDTHGRLDRAVEIYHKLTDVDMIVHLGDYESDCIELAQELGVDFACVKGNMDGAGRTDRHVLETECGRILLTHGHLEGARMSQRGLIEAAGKEKCCAVFFGHTHVPCNEETEGIRILNPGSLTYPRDGSDGSYAIVHTSEEGLEASIVYYGGAARKKSQGGFLRNLMNYSDGF